MLEDDSRRALRASSWNYLPIDAIHRQLDAIYKLFLIPKLRKSCDRELVDGYLFSDIEANALERIWDTFSKHVFSPGDSYTGEDFRISGIVRLWRNLHFIQVDIDLAKCYGFLPPPDPQAVCGISYGNRWWHPIDFVIVNLHPDQLKGAPFPVYSRLSK